MSNLKHNNKDKNQVLLDKLEELKETVHWYNNENHMEFFMHYIEQLEYQVDILNEKIIKNKQK